MSLWIPPSHLAVMKTGQIINFNANAGLKTIDDMARAYQRAVHGPLAGNMLALLEADSEYQSWLDELARQRETRCPGGLPHDYLRTDPQPDERGFYWCCAHCDHHSNIPF